jgi:hypothetical protein
MVFECEEAAPYGVASSFVCHKNAGDSKLPPAQQYERKKVSLFLIAAVICFILVHSR